MNSDLRALVRSMLATPEDDLPRLVYADWLEEHDKPTLAELTRLQCGVADHRDRKRGSLYDVQDIMARRNALHSSPGFYAERGAAWASWGYFYRGLIPTVEFRLSSWVPQELEDLGHTYGLKSIQVPCIDSPEQLGEFLRWQVVDDIPNLYLEFSDPKGHLTGPMLRVAADRPWASHSGVVTLGRLNFRGDAASKGLNALARLPAQTVRKKMTFRVDPGCVRSRSFARFKEIVGDDVARRSIQ